MNSLYPDKIGLPKIFGFKTIKRSFCIANLIFLGLLNKKRHLLLVLDGEGEKLQEILIFPTHKALSKEMGKLAMKKNSLLAPDQLTISYLEQFGWHNLYRKNMPSVLEQIYSGRFSKSRRSR